MTKKSSPANLSDAELIAALDEAVARDRAAYRATNAALIELKRRGLAPPPGVRSLDDEDADPYGDLNEARDGFKSPRD